MPLKLVKRHASPFWYARGTVSGRRVDESTQTADRAVAEAWRARREWQLQQEAVFGTKGRCSFAEAVTAYLEHARDARFIAPLLAHFGTAPLASITPQSADDAARALYPNAKPATINRQFFTPLSAILHHAAGRGLCDPPRFRRPKLPRGRLRWLTPAEAEALIAASPAHLRPMVLFLLYTGARMKEMIRLEWRCVELQRAHVSFEDTKNATSRGVPLHPRVVAALASLPHRVGRVFLTPAGRPYAGKCAEGGEIKTAFRNTVRRAGIQSCTPHTLRHTWATWHYAANRDLTALMALGGWKSVGMVMRYAHVNAAQHMSSIERLPSGEILGK